MQRKLSNWGSRKNAENGTWILSWEIMAIAPSNCTAVEK